MELSTRQTLSSGLPKQRPKTESPPRTLLRDANLGGMVDAVVLNALGKLIGYSNTWQKGDFNADSTVDAIDLNEIGIDWPASISLVAAQSVTEPPGILLLIVAGSLAVVSRSTNSSDERLEHEQKSTVLGTSVIRILLCR